MNHYFTQDFWMGFLQKTGEWVLTVVPALILLTIVLIIALKLVKMLIHKLHKVVASRAEKHDPDHIAEIEKRINTLMGILHGLGKIILWSVFLMILLKKLGIDIGPILAGAGILGLAVGFGAQELVRDFISGFFILLENQIRAGDVAIINGTGGLVERIELRTTSLRDFSGTVHVFQNGKINSLSNMTKEWSAIVFDMGVAYKEDVDHVMKVMKEVGDELKNSEEYGPNILEPIEIFGVDQFADSAVVIKARLKTKPIQQWTIGREYRRRLKIAFDKEGIEIPFPHTTLYWGEEIKPLQVNMNNSEK